MVSVDSLAKLNVFQKLFLTALIHDQVDQILSRERSFFCLFRVFFNYLFFKITETLTEFESTNAKVKYATDIGLHGQINEPMLLIINGVRYKLTSISLVWMLQNDDAFSSRPEKNPEEKYVSSLSVDHTVKMYTDNKVTALPLHIVLYFIETLHTIIVESSTVVYFH